METEKVELVLSEIKAVLGKADYRKLIHFWQSNSITLFTDFETGLLHSKEQILEMGKYSKSRLIKCTFFVDCIDKIQPICEKNSVKITSIWFIINRSRDIQRKEYKQKPTKIRKDNGTEINYGTGNSNRNKIRFPKKCRKTAWKRFNRLFPNR